MHVCAPFEADKEQRGLFIWLFNIFNMPAMMHTLALCSMACSLLAYVRSMLASTP